MLSPVFSHLLESSTQCRTVDPTVEIVNKHTSSNFSLAGNLKSNLIIDWRLQALLHGVYILDKNFKWLSFDFIFKQARQLPLPPQSHLLRIQDFPALTSIRYILIPKTRQGTGIMKPPMGPSNSREQC